MVLPAFAGTLQRVVQVVVPLEVTLEFDWLQNWLQQSAGFALEARQYR